MRRNIDCTFREARFDLWCVSGSAEDRGAPVSEVGSWNEKPHRVLGSYQHVSSFLGSPRNSQRNPASFLSLF